MDNENLKKEILERIKAIFFKLYKTDIDITSNSSMKADIFTNKYFLQPRDLVYMFFEVQKEFNIRIPQSSIINGCFRTIYGIMETVYSQLEIAKKL